MFSSEKVFIKVYKNLDEYYHDDDFDKKIITRSDEGSYRNHIILYNLVRKIDEHDQSVVWALSKVVYIELADNNRIKVQFQLDENFSEPQQLLKFLKLPRNNIMYIKEVEYTGCHKISAKYLTEKYSLQLHEIITYFLHCVYLDYLTKFFFEIQDA